MNELELERMEAEMAVLCVCGHERRHHMGPTGTCIRGVLSGEASVCPCDRFTRAAS